MKAKRKAVRHAQLLAAFVGLVGSACARGATPDSLSGDLTVDAQAATAVEAGASDPAGPASQADASLTVAGDGAVAPGAMSGTPPPECDLTGQWALVQFTDSIVNLGIDSKQRAANYFYFNVVQQGTEFTIQDSLRCGIVVTGATTVTISDATLTALLEHDNSNGRRGTYTPNGSSCDFALEETVNVMGCSTPHYRINRSEPLPTATASGTTPGTEDWDHDNFDGITLNSGGGPRYVAMRDWNSYAGSTPQYVTDKFQVAVSWDSEENVLEPTNFILRVPSRRDDAGDHHVIWRKLTSGDGFPRASGLETCKAVQALLANEY